MPIAKNCCLLLLVDHCFDLAAHTPLEVVAGRTAAVPGHTEDQERIEGQAHIVVGPVRIEDLVYKLRQNRAVGNIAAEAAVHKLVEDFQDMAEDRYYRYKRCMDS